MNLSLARVLSHCGGAPVEALRYVVGAVADNPRDPEPYRVILEIRDQHPEVTGRLAGTWGALVRAYMSRLDGDMDESVRMLGALTGHHPAVPWAEAPWFDAEVIAGVSPPALADAAQWIVDPGHDLDTEDVRRCLEPWSRMIDEVCARRPDATQMARMAILLRFAGWTAESLALCDRADTVERLMLTEVVRGGTYRRLGDRAGTRACFERALALDPGNWSLFLDLADLDAEDGEFARAAESAAEGLRHEPGEPSLVAAEAAYRARATGSVEAFDRLLACAAEVPHAGYRDGLIRCALEAPDLSAERREAAADQFGVKRP